MQTALENQLHLFDMFAAIWALMKSSMFRSAALLFLIPACAFSATNVVNLSHYDMMRPDFTTMKRQGIVGVIHEATYPPFVRDPKYLDGKWGRCKRDCSGEHITTLTEVIQFGRLIIS